MAKRPSKVYVHGHSTTNDKELWYCIDLKSLPETDEELSLSPIAELGVDRVGGWALMGDHIYWAGRIDDPERVAPMELYKHNIITSPNSSSLDIVSSYPQRRLRYRPRVVPLHGNKILVLGVQDVIYEEEDEDEHVFGEVYDIDTGIGHPCAYNLKDFSSGFINLHSALLTSPDGAEVEKVVFYSFHYGLLLFYNVSDDTFRLELHPLFRIPRKIYILYHVLMNVTPVVMDSTLYWFTYDLYLHGYDFVRKTWFRSLPLKADELWELPDDPYGDFVTFPILVNLHNGRELLLVVETPCSDTKLGMAFLAISKPEKGEVLDVTVKSRHTLSVDPRFVPKDGIAMPNNTRSSAIHGPSNSAMEN